MLVSLATVKLTIFLSNSSINWGQKLYIVSSYFGLSSLQKRNKRHFSIISQHCKSFLNVSSLWYIASMLKNEKQWTSLHLASLAPSAQVWLLVIKLKFARIGISRSVNPTKSEIMQNLLHFLVNGYGILPQRCIIAETFGIVVAKYTKLKPLAGIKDSIKNCDVFIKCQIFHCLFHFWLLRTRFY